MKNCSFTNCISPDLSNLIFIDFTFEACDLSIADLTNTAFRNTIFTECKMLGLYFDHGNQWLFSLINSATQL